MQGHGIRDRHSVRVHLVVLEPVKEDIEVECGDVVADKDVGVELA